MARDVLIVESYLEALAARLPGSRGQRREVLDELRDGLVDATDRRISGGLSPEAAAEAAIAEFGSVDEVAGAFAGELVTRQARRTLLALLFTGPLVGVWWLFLFSPRSPAGIPTVPLIGTAVLIGLVTLATTGRLTRWLPAATPVRALGGATAVAVACVVGDGAVLTMLAARPTGDLGAVAVVAVVASLVRLGCCGHVLLQHLAARKVLRWS